MNTSLKIYNLNDDNIINAFYLEGSTEPEMVVIKQQPLIEGYKQPYNEYSKFDIYLIIVYLYIFFKILDDENNDFSHLNIFKNIKFSDITEKTCFINYKYNSIIYKQHNIKNNYIAFKCLEKISFIYHKLLSVSKEYIATQFNDRNYTPYLCFVITKQLINIYLNDDLYEHNKKYSKDIFKNYNNNNNIEYDKLYDKYYEMYKETEKHMHYTAEINTYDYNKSEYITLKINKNICKNGLYQIALYLMKNINLNVLFNKNDKHDKCILLS